MMANHYNAKFNLISDFSLHIEAVKIWKKWLKKLFKFAFNEKTKTWYIYKEQDELTKNHKDIDEKVSGFMPENKDDPLCPVQSFWKYLQHLHPENNYLWQTPLEKVNTNTATIWYSKQHLGKNTLGNFMVDVSRECQLSKKYTSHSIWVTAATVLTKQKFFCIRNYEHNWPQECSNLNKVPMHPRPTEDHNG